MSKLHKFAEFLTIDDAAEYLSYLIKEPVSSADIHRLNKQHKLPGFVMEQREIIKLERILSENSNHSHLRYKLDFGAADGVCYGFWLPCRIENILVDDCEATALLFKDDNGDAYTILDDSGFILGDSDHQENYSHYEENMLFLPSDILNIANIANSEMPVPTDNSLSRKKLDTYPPMNLYNVGVSWDSDIIRRMKADIPNRDKPSQLLTIGAMLDVVLNDPKVRTQDALSGEIEQRFSAVRGLGKTTVNTLFSAAKKALRAAEDESRRD